MSETKVVQQDRLLSVHEVVARTGLSRASIWRLRQQQQFPQAVHLIAKRVAWRESEIAAWIAARPRA